MKIWSREFFFEKKVAGRGVAGMKNPPPPYKKKKHLFQKMVKKNFLTFGVKPTRYPSTRYPPQLFFQTVFSSGGRV
jgi:hypothetical protein